MRHKGRDGCRELKSGELSIVDLSDHVRSDRQNSDDFHPFPINSPGILPVLASSLVHNSLLLPIGTGYRCAYLQPSLVSP